MSEDITDNRLMLNQAWEQIEMRANARIWSLATINRFGKPTVRSVVLRGSDRTNYTLNFHTDLRSAKVSELAADPEACILCWLPQMDLQIRMQVNVKVLSGTAVGSVWDNVPQPARTAYGIAPPPGSVIETASQYVLTSDKTQFGVLECVIDQIDLLHLFDVHRRAVYSRDGDWVGEWVAP